MEKKQQQTVLKTVTRKKARTNQHKTSNHVKGKQGKNANSLRIIGGDWRSRKLAFIDAPGLRPTPDRIRETLFNWLQGRVHGAYCIDMFAGSGALGFEALSRGAKELVFVEKNAACVHQLKENLTLLKADSTVLQCDALAFLSKIPAPKKPFDLVFLDPPYRQDLVPKSLHYLQNEGLLNENSLIYLEHESEENYKWEDFGLNVLKEAKAGQVHSFLLSMNA